MNTQDHLTAPVQSEASISALTPWFPIEVKPARNGVYNVSCRASQQTGKWYGYWDGRKFGWYEQSVDHPSLRDRCYCADLTLSWRGLANKPAESA